MAYGPAESRYLSMAYRRSGRSGLQLPVISLGLWHNFGEDRPFTTQRAICRRAFDLGITHFDLANNYGPPYGAAEKNFGRVMREDFAPYRDELIISTKAGYDMWPGPYGTGAPQVSARLAGPVPQPDGTGLCGHLLSHRFDPDTPLEETMGALDTAVRSGRALYAGISSYSSDKTARAARILRDLGTPLLIHQPSYSLLNRWIEEQSLLDTLAEQGAGCIAFSPLAQGLLSSRYLSGIPVDSRAATGGALDAGQLTDERLSRVRALAAMAQRRGQSLAQLAVAWCLRDPRMTSVLMGASSVAQLEENIAALSNLDFTAAELADIDTYATEAGIDLWAGSSAHT